MQFKYLGSMITSDGKCEKDITSRIGMAKAAFWELKAILTNRHISYETRLRVLKCYVWSVLLYGAETWTNIDYIQGHAEEIGSHRNVVSSKDVEDCMDGKENQ